MLYLGIDQHKRQLTVNLRGEDEDKSGDTLSVLTIWVVPLDSGHGETGTVSHSWNAAPRDAAWQPSAADLLQRRGLRSLCGTDGRLVS